MAADSLTSKWSICLAFASSAFCGHKHCKYSHTLLDTARIIALVGDISQLSLGPPAPSLPSSSNATTAHTEQTLFLIEYTKYSSQADSSSGAADRAQITWRMRLSGGGRATMSAGAESVSVHPSYPVKGSGGEAGTALHMIENQVFGRSHPPDLNRRSLCRAHTEGTCRRASCGFSHTLFDTKRIELLLSEAITERGYSEYRPILEIEFVGRRDAAGQVTCVWRVTLRCVLGYHQKAAPQPVVITSADLNTAMRLLERQFAGSSGRTPSSSQPQTQTNTSPRAGSGHRRRASSTNTAHPPSRDSRTHTPPVPPTSPRRPASCAGAMPRPMANTNERPNSPPPSYQDSFRSDYVPNASSHDTKRRL